MKPRGWTLVLTLALASLASLTAPACAADTFDIAITVDDLPAHGPLPAGMTRLDVAVSHLRTLKAHGVGEAFGFVNAAKVDSEAGGDAVLALWRAAGYPLGNHSYSHMSLDRAPSLKAWQADVEKGEGAVSRHMIGADWRWFRFPNLAAGPDPARRDGAAAFLKQRGYRIAHVTLAFSDWSYTDAYVRCSAKGDSAAIEAMKAQYLQGVEDGIARMKRLSNRLYGRVIPQVLLTHVGAWSALMLPQVMARLDRAGAHYVTLARAEADPAYRAAERLGHGGNLMENEARQGGIDLSDIAGPQPTTNLASLCR